MGISEGLGALWSATRFSGDELTAYAERWMVEDTRKGVMTMSFVSLLLLASTSLLYTLLGQGVEYVYTHALLGALSLHIYLSARAMREIRVLYLLSMTLLIISGVAFVLLAHRTGSFSTALLGSVILLFMIVPMVPWGLKQAATVVSLIYAVFTVSTWGNAARFDFQTLLTLQFVMLGASLVTLILVGRGVLVRRDDIQARFELENAHQRVELLSFQDALTGSWNRRYLEHHFPSLLAAAREADAPLWFVLCDLNEFKVINDSLGHDVGDRILRWFANAFRNQIGERGIAVRMGGDEFALVFSHHSPSELLHRCLEAVQALVRQDHCARGAKVGLSAGVLVLAANADTTLDGAYRKADQYLYAAKRRENLQACTLRVVGQDWDLADEGDVAWTPAH